MQDNESSFPDIHDRVIVSLDFVDCVIVVETDYDIGRCCRFVDQAEEFDVAWSEEIECSVYVDDFLVLCGEDAFDKRG